MAKEKIEGKEKLLSIFKKAFAGYFKNLALALPFLFIVLIAIILAILFAFISSSTIQNLQANPLSQISQTDSLLLLFLIGVFFLILMYSYSFLVSGTVGMAIEIRNNNKASLKTLTKFGSKFWLKFLGITIILITTILISLLALVFITDIFVKSLPIAIQTISLFAILSIAILIYVFLMLSPYLLIVKDIGVFASIKESINLAKKYYLDLLLITLLFIVLEVLMGLIPYAGQIINLLIIAPLQILTLVIFINVRSEK